MTNTDTQFSNLRAAIQAEEIRWRTATEAAVEKILKHAMERARVNTPIKTGTLRAGYRTSVKSTKRKVTGTLKNDVPYAWENHEKLSPAGSRQLGPLSAAQPGTPEGGVGGKFIQRVIQHHAGKYTKMLQGELKGKISKRPRR